jgi:hypothetical protein
LFNITNPAGLWPPRIRCNMRNAISIQPTTNNESLNDCSDPSSANRSVVLPFRSPTDRVEQADQRSRRQLVSTRELSEIWGVPESSLRYWLCAEVGPPYMKGAIGEKTNDRSSVRRCQHLGPPQPLPQVVHKFHTSQGDSQ